MKTFQRILLPYFFEVMNKRNNTNDENTTKPTTEDVEATQTAAMKDAQWLEIGRQIVAAHQHELLQVF